MELDSDSGSESDAPEAVSVSTTKQQAIEREAALKQFSTGEKQRRKAENKARDEKLKLQAASSGKRRRGGDQELEDRMRRAMEDAEAELGEESEDEDLEVGSSHISNDEEEEQEFGGIDTLMSDEEDEEMVFGDDVEEDEELVKPNYLPEHLFASAAIKKPTSSKSKTTEPSKRRKKRKSSNQTAKEMVIGCVFVYVPIISFCSHIVVSASSRTIRTLPTSTLPSPKNLSHSAKARKFLRRSLSKPRGREGWDRRAGGQDFSFVTLPPTDFPSTQQMLELCAEQMDRPRSLYGMHSSVATICHFERVPTLEWLPHERRQVNRLNLSCRSLNLFVRSWQSFLCPNLCHCRALLSPFALGPLIGL